jgi:hypothetical protein
MMAVITRVTPPHDGSFGYSALEEEILRFHSSFTALMNRMMTHMQLRCGGDEAQESIDIRSLRQYNALLAELEMLAGDERYEKLWFDFRHITDELVFYGMRAQTSHLVSPLAKYTVVKLEPRANSLHGRLTCGPHCRQLEL